MRQVCSTMSARMNNARVADHDVIDQRLVSDIWFFGEPVIVVEVHFHGGEVYNRPPTLDLELQGNSLVRRNAEDQPVGPQSVDRRILERRIGRLLEADRYLGIPLRQMLARAEVKGHASPAPVVDLKLHRDISLGVRIRRDIRLLPIGFRVYSQHCAGAVLATHRRCRLYGWRRANASTFFERIAAASKPVGGSIATVESNVNK